MVSIRTSPVDAPDAHALLEEYFALRAAIFPGGAYRTVFPSPATFVEPAGVFVVLDDQLVFPYMGTSGIAPGGKRGM